MKLIDSSVKYIDTTTLGPTEIIERVGRTCYKSESAFDKESSIKFFKQLVDRHHYAMLEHATFIFLLYVEDLEDKVMKSPHVNVTIFNKFVTVSANLRSIKENNLTSYMAELIHHYPELNYYFGLESAPKTVCHVSLVTDIGKWCVVATEEEIKKHLHFTFHFTCDRGVSHEMVRHRPASFAQESTRYCNYSKDKFGKEITCIKPAFYYDDSKWTNEAKSVYENALKQAEFYYFMLLDKGLTPQQARGVLPTDLKTEIIMTANFEEWEHFFALRAKGVTGAPHPNMKKVALEAYNVFTSLLTNHFNIYVLDELL